MYACKSASRKWHHVWNDMYALSETRIYSWWTVLLSLPSVRISQVLWYNLCTAPGCLSLKMWGCKSVVHKNDIYLVSQYALIPTSATCHPAVTGFCYTIKKPLISQGFQLLMYGDPDWVRTSDPHPVKMVLSQLSYRIVRYVCDLEPSNLCTRLMVGPVGLEPTTNRLWADRSDQLS